MHEFQVYISERYWKSAVLHILYMFECVCGCMYMGRVHQKKFPLFLVYQIPLKLSFVLSIAWNPVFDISSA